jgi:hypothetical protein
MTEHRMAMLEALKERARELKSELAQVEAAIRAVGRAEYDARHSALYDDYRRKFADLSYYTTQQADWSAMGNVVGHGGASEQAAAEHAAEARASAAHMFRLSE